MCMLDVYAIMMCRPSSLYKLYDVYVYIARNP